MERILIFEMDVHREKVAANRAQPAGRCQLVVEGVADTCWQLDREGPRSGPSARRSDAENSTRHGFDPPLS